MTDLDQHAVRELQLFIENDYGLYNSMIVPTEKQLVKKKRKGTYNEMGGKLAFTRIVREGAKKYCKVNGGTWNKVFGVRERLEVAKILTKSFETEYNLGNYE